LLYHIIIQYYLVRWRYIFSTAAIVWFHQKSYYVYVFSNLFQMKNHNMYIQQIIDTIGWNRIKIKTSNGFKSLFRTFSSESETILHIPTTAVLLYPRGTGAPLNRNYLFPELRMSRLSYIIYFNVISSDFAIVKLQLRLKYQI